METIRLTTAQAIVKFLNQQFIEFDGTRQRFVKGVFTIFGHGNVLGMGQALEEHPGELNVYQGRNEQGMAHAAVAFAKQNHRKQIMACTSSIGPGSANLVTAASTATANQIPVLLFPGDVFATRQPDPALQQIEQTHDPSVTTNDALRPVSKYWDRINRPEQVMTALLNAMRVLTNQADTGAVTIALPQDVQGEAFDFPAAFFKERVHRIERRLPTQAELDDAVNLITSKKKPLIVCGGGVRYAEAADDLKTFAETYNIPFVETQAGKGAVRSNHPFNLGGVGVTGNLAANRLAREADLVIGVGTRFSDFTTSSKTQFSHPEVDFLTINASDFHARKFDATKVVADAAGALQQLTKALQSVDYKTAYKGDVQEAKRDWDKELKRLYSTQFSGQDYTPEVAGHLNDQLPEYAESLDTELTQTAVIGVVNQSIADDSIIVGAAGSLPGDLQRMWQTKSPNTYHMEYGYSCMGYEISGSLGVKLARPDQEVYAMVGDGSFFMLHSELITSLQEDKKINVVLFDNAGFGCINNLQMGNGMPSIGTEFRHRDQDAARHDGKIMNVDFAKVAEGYGLKTYQVKSLEDLKHALEDAKQQERSTLIDIKVLPKTMTGDYDSWWHVGVAEVSDKTSIKEAYKEKQAHLEEAQKY
ncbi:3D-(3,5/4)-trihydroxycyclohexane-1,2-dione acylhydrolase (decyclizing) [Tuberibacillus sp. Marseille-P3662]|uniref:3D-(3,5/4)-trihydroxycyclohexane-1,2-dione acylhydrolase (decyclizing) n=1 Tax=Tuberibacillus sp. Marseille-P3662 TaxID=1965358 RepID=UPI000A1C9440|nr:3D-(3,5/4)-trihydroxycyclohexane-1,2-dione acylhydrolase (decyclizing) [Tuberibacillus sp. Marseille-P3662]